jgi:transposase
MLEMHTITKVRRLYYIEKKGFKTIARELRLSKNTVKKLIREGKTVSKYQREQIYYRVLGPYKEQLEGLIEADRKEPKQRQRTAKKYYEALQGQGYQGGYDSINRYIKAWKRNQPQEEVTGYAPLVFEPGGAFQFDWSEEEVEMGGEIIRIKAAHIRLCYSRNFLIIAYPHEQLEMVMDAHDRGFAYFGGSCQEGIYDNMRTVVRKILVGKEREYNERFKEMASHYVFEPRACNPRAGWEKGQVERQVRVGRQNFFTPLCRVGSFEELNEQLQEACLRWTKTTIHPEFKDQTVWDVYQSEREHLIPYQRPFGAYKVETGVASICGLVQFDTNQYSVDCHYARLTVTLHIYAHEVVIMYRSQEIGRHKRCFKRYQRIYNPWHYVPLLERKPGILRHGAPFKNWDLPKPLSKIRQALKAYPDSDKQFIGILMLVKAHGLDTINKACIQVLNQGGSSLALVKQALMDPQPEPPLMEYPVVESMLEDCNNYDLAYLNLAQEVSHAA